MSSDKQVSDKQESGNEQEWPEVQCRRLVGGDGKRYEVEVGSPLSTEPVVFEGERYVPTSFLVEEQERHARVVEQLAECYRATGSEPSAVESMDAMYAVRAVKELREEYDECPVPEDLAKERERLEVLEEGARKIDGWASNCKCGWRGPVRRAPREAEEDGAMHVCPAAYPALRSQLLAEMREALTGDEALSAVVCQRIGIRHDEKRGRYDSERHARELIGAALATLNKESKEEK